jgi:hypothetical protein
MDDAERFQLLGEYKMPRDTGRARPAAEIV